jgi:hypothetical protein
MATISYWAGAHPTRLHRVRARPGETVYPKGARLQFQTREKLMAKVAEMNEAAMAEWLEERPQVIKDMATRHPPNLLYRMKSTGHRVTLYSYSEDGTVSVIVSGRYNLLTFERKVFGVNPDDLEECDFPPSDEPVGAMLTEDADVREFIDAAKSELSSTDNGSA